MFVEVSSVNGGGAAILVALADTGASTSLLTKDSADRIRLCINDSDIELKGLNGPANTVGRHMSLSKSQEWR